MTQYIDKATVVAEIDRLIERAKAERVLYPKTILSAKNLLLLEDYDRLKKFINKIEMMECYVEYEKNKLIEKACEYIAEWFYNHPHTNIVCSDEFENIDDLIERFKKAMEE